MPYLICKQCERELIRPCRWGGPEDHDVAAEVGVAAVTAGVMVVLEDEDSVVVTGPGGPVGTKIYSPAGAIAANPDDLLPDALVSAGCDNGCCGSDGTDGPNRACLCGALVATQWSDCWTQAEIRFLPQAVIVRD
ncbi:MAG TPA: hypothetical protein PLF78_06750 [Caulobacter sp.]|nr:hypothetical protein [Caulobacter sp.]